MIVSLDPSDVGLPHAPSMIPGFRLNSETVMLVSLGIHKGENCQGEVQVQIKSLWIQRFRLIGGACVHSISAQTLKSQIRWRIADTPLPA